MYSSMNSPPLDRQSIGSRQSNEFITFKARPSNQHQDDQHQIKGALPGELGEKGSNHVNKFQPIVLNSKRQTTLQHSNVKPQNAIAAQLARCGGGGGGGGGSLALRKNRDFQTISLESGGGGTDQNHHHHHQLNYQGMPQQAVDKSLELMSCLKNGQLAGFDRDTLGSGRGGGGGGGFDQTKEGREPSCDSDLGPPFKFAGIIACAASTIFFSLSLLCVKLLPDSESIEEKTKAILFRGLCLMVLCGGSMIYQKADFKIKRDEITINVIRAIVGFFGSYGTYIALHYITVGESTAIIYSSPVWTSLLSFFLLGEPLPLTLVFALPLGALGIIMIAHPDLIIGLLRVEDEVLAEVERHHHPIVLNDSVAFLPHHINTTYEFLTNSTLDFVQSSSGRMAEGLVVGLQQAQIVNVSDFNELVPEIDPEVATELYLDHRLPGIIISIATSLFVSLVFISLKYRREANVQKATFYLGVGIVIIATLIHCYVGFGRWPGTFIEWALLIGVGLNSWTAQTLFQWSLSHDKASILSVVRTVDVVMAFFWSALFLEEDILWTSLVGAAIIVSIVIILMLNDFIEKLLCCRCKG